MIRILVLIVSLLVSYAASATDYTAATLSQTDVQAVVDTASDGDRVILPAGTSPVWSSAVNITKMIDFGGAGFDAGGGTVIQHSKQMLAITCHLSDKNLIVHDMQSLQTGSGASTNIGVNGVARAYIDGGVVKGGFGLHDVKWKATTAAGANVYAWKIGSAGWVTGCMWHCMVDYDPAWGGGERADTSMRTSPTGSSTPLGSVGDYGHWSWYAPYTYGGSLPGKHPTKNQAGDDTSGDTFYIEDCVFNITGVFSDKLSGGSRTIERHLSQWCGFAAHGTESGNNAGVVSAEFYNNKVWNNDSTPQSWNIHPARGGGLVVFNEYWSGWKDSYPINLIVCRQDGEANILGPSDGTNFYDLNQRGTFGPYNGRTWNPIEADPANQRIGSVYARGTVTAKTTLNGAQAYTVSGIDGIATNAWSGFVARNVNTSQAASAGGQAPPVYADRWGSVIENTGSNPITFSHSGNCNALGLQAAVGEVIEFRKVIKYCQTAGSGTMDHAMDGHNLKNNTAPILVPLFVGETFSLGNPQWTNQLAPGIWFWGNKQRLKSNNNATSFSNVGSNPFTGFRLNYIQGGYHDNDASAGDSNGAPKAGWDGNAAGYPKVSSPTDAQRTVGADVDRAPAFKGSYAINSDVYGSTILVGTNNVYGGPYPHPMRGAIANSAPIFTSANNTSLAPSVTGTFTVRTNASPTAAITKTAGTLPGTYTFTDNGDGTATITGSSSSGSVNVLTLHAANSVGSVNQTFTLTITSPNNAPTVAISPPPANGATYTAPAIVPLTATANDVEGPLNHVEFFQGTNSLGTVSTTPYTITPPAWSAGTYSFTAVATDNGSPPLSTTSAAVNITVNAASTTPTPATIRISP